MSAVTTLSPEEALALHQRLCAGDAAAPGELTADYLDYLTEQLLRIVSHADPDDCLEAAGEALCNFVRAPGALGPGLGGVTPYLRHAALCDLRNLQARERRHHRLRVPWEEVEDRPDGWKYLGR